MTKKFDEFSNKKRTTVQHVLSEREPIFMVYG